MNNRAVASILNVYLSGRSRNTRRAYESALNDFGRFRHDVAPGALRSYLSGGPSRAYEIVARYKDALLGRKLSPETVNQRLAVVRGVCRTARMMGVIRWDVALPGLRLDEPYRDTLGVGVDGYRKLVEATKSLRNVAARRRDAAVLHLLFDLALRRQEASSLDLDDLELGGRTLQILGKGLRSKRALRLPTETADALAQWLAVRGLEPGPLFWNFDPSGKGGRRLSGHGVWRVVKRAAARAGLSATPHKIRHSAITAALDCGADLRSVQRYSRHRQLQTLLVYDDNRRDPGGRVATLVAEVGSGKRSAAPLRRSR